MQNGKSSGLDWRTLLAFGIMILLWVVFSRYFMPRQPEPAEEPESVATDVIESPAEAPIGDRGWQAEQPPERPDGRDPTIADPHASDRAAGRPAESRRSTEARWELVNTLPAADEQVVIDGPLFRAVFSARGAQLRSWALKEYTDANEGPADLVSDPDVGALSLQLEGPEGRLDLSRTVFAVEQYREGGSGSADPGGGVQVVRFTADGPLRERAPEAAWGPAADTPPEAETAPGGPRVRVERTYRIDPARYDMQMALAIEGISNHRQDHHIILAWEEGIPFLERQEKLERRAKGAVALLAEQLVKDDFGGGSFGCGCGGGRASQGGKRVYEGVLRWAGVRTKYFAALLVPGIEQNGVVVTDSDPDAGRVGMRLLLPMADEGRTAIDFAIYAGPIDYRILREFDNRIDREVTRLVSFGGKLIAPISKAAHWFLLQVYSVIPNYGVAILALAVFLRLLFHPLTVKSLRSQRKLQLLKPEIDRLNEQYKDDPQLRAKKTMEFHKQHGVNPLSGCLPLLIQMPAIYALYGVLMNAIELRKAPFVLWMRDLAAPDKVGEIFGIPIHVLPILMAATMFVQQKMTPTDPRQAPMLIMMPLFMVFIFYSLPSGLVLYWTITNLLTMAQQMAMKPQNLVLSEPEPEPARPKRKTRSRKRK